MHCLYYSPALLFSVLALSSFYIGLRGTSFCTYNSFVVFVFFLFFFVGCLRAKERFFFYGFSLSAFSLEGHHRQGF